MRNNEILVSVYCLAYNHENYIRNCLDGFVNQKTNFKFEVIVHDDASTDGTADIIREYAEKYPEIIKPILQKENQYSKGISKIYTYIYPELKGKYVAICEGDDYWIDMHKLQKQVDILEAKSEYVACVHQTKCIDCLKGREGLVSALNKNGIIDKALILKRDSPIYHTSSLCYRRELLSKEPDFCSICRGVSDYPFGMFLALEGKIYFINEVMSVYRQYADGSWSLGNKKRRIDITYVNEMITMLDGVDKYSDYKYHEFLEIPILEFKYKFWKARPRFSIIKDEYFKKLSLKRKVKMLGRMVFEILRR